MTTAAALGDWRQIQRTFQRQVAEAEDPAAVKRVLQSFANIRPENFVLTAGQIAHLEAATRAGLAGRSIVEIEDIREQARDAYRQACAAAGGDHDTLGSTQPNYGSACAPASWPGCRPPASSTTTAARSTMSADSHRDERTGGSRPIFRHAAAGPHP